MSSGQREPPTDRECSGCAAAGTSELSAPSSELASSAAPEHRSGREPVRATVRPNAAMPFFLDAGYLFAGALHVPLWMHRWWKGRFPIEGLGRRLIGAAPASDL